MAEPVKVDGGGLRYNEGKPPLELIPPEPLWAMAGGLQYGAGKYAPRNWERGMAWSKPYACLMRHLLKWWEGKEIDEESGLPHLWHVLINAAFLTTYSMRQIGEDDRPKMEVKP